MRLVFFSDSDRRYRLELRPGRFTLGRDEHNNIVIEEPTISGRHSTLFSDNGVWYVEDKSSTNGVSVNGRSANGRQRLHNGDHVALGNVNITVELDQWTDALRLTTAESTSQLAQFWYTYRAPITALAAAALVIAALTTTVLILNSVHVEPRLADSAIELAPPSTTASRQLSHENRSVTAGTDSTAVVTAHVTPQSTVLSEMSTEMAAMQRDAMDTRQLPLQKSHSQPPMPDSEPVPTDVGMQQHNSQTLVTSSPTTPSLLQALEDTIVTPLSETPQARKEAAKHLSDAPTPATTNATWAPRGAPLTTTTTRTTAVSGMPATTDYVEPYPSDDDDDIPDSTLPERETPRYRLPRGPHRDLFIKEWKQALRERGLSRHDNFLLLTDKEQRFVRNMAYRQGLRNLEKLENKYYHGINVNNQPEHWQPIAYQRRYGDVPRYIPDWMPTAKLHSPAVFHDGRNEWDLDITHEVRGFDFDREYRLTVTLNGKIVVQKEFTASQYSRPARQQRTLLGPFDIPDSMVATPANTLFLVYAEALDGLQVPGLTIHAQAERAPLPQAHVSQVPRDAWNIHQLSIDFCRAVTSADRTRAMRSAIDFTLSRFSRS